MTLRDEALARTAQDLGLLASGEQAVIFGILVEVGSTDGVATLVVFAEGSTSLYFSNGGGVIGAGEHAAVRATHDVLFTEAAERLKAFTLTAETPLPDPDRVRFYLRTFRGTLTAEAAERDLMAGRHDLASLYQAGQGVIAAVIAATGHTEQES